VKLMATLQRICRSPRLTLHSFRKGRADKVRETSAAEEQRAEWLGTQFWDRLEGRHQRVQSQHEAVRQNLERITPKETEELRHAWRRYCEVIAELEQTAAEFEAVRD
jgi:hypothetical protein